MRKDNITTIQLQDSLKSLENQKNIDLLYQKVTTYIDQARQSVQRVIDSAMVRAYWHIGKDIVEEEQKGQKRSEYGSFLLKSLSSQLMQKYGRGFGVTTLKDIRKFYLTYSDIELKGHAVRDFFTEQINPKLGWIHYRALMRVNRLAARQFYEIESVKNNWSGRELERQINSLLFDRLAGSKDKAGLIKLSCIGVPCGKVQIFSQGIFRALLMLLTEDQLILN